MLSFVVSCLPKATDREDIRPQCPGRIPHEPTSRLFCASAGGTASTILSAILRPARVHPEHRTRRKTSGGLERHSLTGHFETAPRRTAFGLRRVLASRPGCCMAEYHKPRHAPSCPNVAFLLIRLLRLWHPNAPRAVPVATPATSGTSPCRCTLRRSNTLACRGSGCN
jgi:hypothetical protein